MTFLENLNLFGDPAKEIPCITGKGAPTTSTEGAVGCFYMDTDTGDIYKCTAVSQGSYTWNPSGGSSGIYIGSGDMPDGYDVQIDPDGEPIVLPEFEPLIVTINQEEDSNGTAQRTSHTPAEIMAAVEQGRQVYLDLTETATEWFDGICTLNTVGTRMAIFTSHHETNVVEYYVVLSDRSIEGCTDDVISVNEIQEIIDERLGDIGEWELIETITVEEEGLTAITRNATPDEIGYNLSAAKVISKVYYPLDTLRNVRCDFVCNGTDLARIPTYIPKGTTTEPTHCSSTICSATPNAGLYEFVSAYGSQGAAMSVIYPSNAWFQSVSTERKINEIRYVLFDGTTFPVGTEIQIWAVRAGYNSTAIPNGDEVSY